MNFILIPLLIIYVVIIVFILVGLWKIFTKAGQPGWGSLIPIYNLYLLTKIAQKPGWWVLMLCIPVANLVFAIMLWNEVAKRFGKDTGYTVGLILLSFVFIPLLGLGDAQYTPEETEND